MGEAVYLIMCDRFCVENGRVEAIAKRRLPYGTLRERRSHFKQI
ncbi:MAG TPA: hypothetical protein VK184_16365 [Nostocaceae cyanobacterium]|nr:hypothetical protein [Nostocaceae cyanobacterium]